MVDISVPYPVLSYGQTFAVHPRGVWMVLRGEPPGCPYRTRGSGKNIICSQREGAREKEITQADKHNKLKSRPHGRIEDDRKKM